MAFLLRVAIRPIATALLSCLLAASASAEEEPMAAGKKSAIKSKRIFVPLTFESNVGQTDKEVRFLVRRPGYALFLADNEIVQVFPFRPSSPSKRDRSFPGEVERLSTVLRMRLDGAKVGCRPEAGRKLRGCARHYVGLSDNENLACIPLFESVIYADVYPDIDLVFYSHRGKVRYKIVVGRDGDPADIRFRFSGAESLELDRQGNLHVAARNSGLVHTAPMMFETKGVGRTPIKGSFVLLDENTVGFRVARRSPGADLIIDPEIACGSYVGGVEWSPEAGQPARVAPIGDTGEILLSGSTQSVSFPATNETTLAGQVDSFVMRLDLSDLENPALLHASYLGGSYLEFNNGLAFVDQDRIFLSGMTYSVDFPVDDDAYVTSVSAGATFNSYVARLDGSLNLERATYLGWSHISTTAMAAESTGVYAVGWVSSEAGDLATDGAAQEQLGGYRDAFCVKLNNDLTAAEYFTYIGGNSRDCALAVALVDGAAFVAGETASPNFPIVSAAQGTPGLGAAAEIICGNVEDPPLYGYDAFLTQLNPAGTSFEHSTYFGGASYDRANGVAVQGQPPFVQAKIVGTIDPLLPNGDTEVFVKSISGDSFSSGSGQIDGMRRDIGTGIVLTAYNEIHVTGETDSSNLATDGSTYQHKDAYYALLDGQGIEYFTYLGGSLRDWGNDIAWDGADGIYIVGNTESHDFTPLVHPLQGSFVGLYDLFLVKLVFDDSGTETLELQIVDQPDPVQVGETLTYTVTARNNSYSTLHDVVLRDLLHPTMLFVEAGPEACQVAGQEIFLVADSLEPQGILSMDITVEPQAPGLIPNDAVLSGSDFEVFSVEETTLVQSASVNGPALLVETVGPPVVDMNESFNFLVKVTNIGNISAPDVVLTDRVEPMKLVHFQSASVTQGTGSIGSSMSEAWFEMGEIFPGDQVVATIEALACLPGNVTNRAEASFGMPPQGDSAFVVTSVSGIEADLEVRVLPPFEDQGRIVCFVEVSVRSLTPGDTSPITIPWAQLFVGLGVTEPDAANTVATILQGEGNVGTAGPFYSCNFVQLTEGLLRLSVPGSVELHSVHAHVVGPVDENGHTQNNASSYP